jgi:hypothetical protein
MTGKHEVISPAEASGQQTSAILPLANHFSSAIPASDCSQTIRPNARFTPSLEYYTSTRPLGTGVPLDKQTHQIYPGGDVKLSKKLILNLGVGVGLTGNW